MPRLRHSKYLLLLGVGMALAAHEEPDRDARLYGSSSGSSVIVVYKKDHDNEGVGGHRDRSDHRDFRGDQRDPADRVDEYRPPRGPGRVSGHKVEQEIRKEHGIKVYPSHGIDDEFPSRGRDSNRDPLEDDPRDARPARGNRGDRMDNRNGGSTVRVTSDSKSSRDDRRQDRDRHRGDKIGSSDFDDSPPASGDDTFRFVKSQLPQSLPRPSSIPSPPPGFNEPRPACARELDLCSHSHDYPAGKVQTIVDRYYNQMYDLYHAMYKIPPHEVQWVENYTHSFNQEKQHGEFVCRSETSYIRIGWAKNYKGRWMAVVNTERFPQTTRVEKCSHREKPCGYLPPCFKTACKQREMLFPLIAVNPIDPSQKPQVDLFPIPSGCVCYVSDAARNLHGQTDGRSSSASRSKLPAFLRSD